MWAYNKRKSAQQWQEGKHQAASKEGTALIDWAETHTPTSDAYPPPPTKAQLRCQPLHKFLNYPFMVIYEDPSTPFDDGHLKNKRRIGIWMLPGTHSYICRSASGSSSIIIRSWYSLYFRFLALSSLICVLFSLLHERLSIISFESMRQPNKAIAWSFVCVFSLSSHIFF